MQKDDKTWLNVISIFVALLIAALVWRFVRFVGITYGFVDGTEVWFNPVVILSAVGLGSLAVFLGQKDEERHAYFLSAIGELRKVLFPSWDDTKKLTTIVCVVVAIFAVILSVFDLFWAKVLKGLLS